MNRLLRATVVVAMLLTAVACNDTEADLTEGSETIYEMTADEVANAPKLSAYDFASGILGWETDVVVGWIEDNGRVGKYSELSTAWRVIWEDGPKETTRDIVDGRHNLIIEKGIVIGIIVEQIDAQDITVMMPEKTNPLSTDPDYWDFCKPEPDWWDESQDGIYPGIVDCGWDGF